MTAVRGKGKPPLLWTQTNKVPFYGLNWDDSYHAPPFLPDISFQQGMGKSGKVCNPKIPGDEKMWIPASKRSVWGTESTQRHGKDKIANIPQQNFPNTFRILLTKHNLNLVPNLTPPPKLNMDLAVISSADSDLGSQVESPICKAHEGIYIFLIPQKLIWKPIQNTTFSSLSYYKWHLRLNQVD